MHIGIDGTTAINEVRAIRRYTWNLLAELGKMSLDDTFSVLYLGCKSGLELPPLENPRFTAVCSKLPGRLLHLGWKFLSRPDASFWIGKDCDIFHFPGGSTYIPVRNSKIITTMHGFLCQVVPDKMENSRLLRTNRILEHTVKTSDYFVTVSEANKLELNKIWNVPLEKITAIPLGVGDEFREYDDMSGNDGRIREKYGLGEKDFLLLVGAIEPHKNIQGIIQAYSMLDSSLKKRFNLVFVGSRTKYSPEYEETCRKLGIAENVVFIDYIPPGSIELAYIYNLASLLVFPTFYEGWASPPLEAMKCGTPALVSDIPSLRESTGGVAHYCNPESPQDIAEKIKEILEDKTLYDKLKKNGLQLAAQYTWGKCAEKTLALYDSLST